MCDNEFNNLTVQEIADIINNKDNPSEYRAKALSFIQGKASRDYFNFRFNIKTEH